jgi:uncharacterized membrane protein
MTHRTTPTVRTPSPLSLRRAAGRLSLSVAIGVITYEWLPASRFEGPVRAIAGWDAASLAILALAWTIILRADANETRRRAGEDDPGRHMVFAIALVASLISLFAATFVMRKGTAVTGAEAATWLRTLLMVAAVVLSWGVTHTAYTLRYAHMYYRQGGTRDKRSEAGLKFCGAEEPSDIDFAYFAFTIGMCFQVSDVVATTTRMRREVLFHAGISFLYNTVILALTLNVLVGLKP